MAGGCLWEVASFHGAYSYITIDFCRRKTQEASLWELAWLWELMSMRVGRQPMGVAIGSCRRCVVCFVVIVACMSNLRFLVIVAAVARATTVGVEVACALPQNYGIMYGSAERARRSSSFGLMRLSRGPQKGVACAPSMRRWRSGSATHCRGHPRSGWAANVDVFAQASGKIGRNTAIVGSRPPLVVWEDNRAARTSPAH